MRLIDADAFKKYCSEGLENMRSCFKTDDGLELAIKTTESFLKDIDEQPTVEAVPKEKIDKAIEKMEVLKRQEDMGIGYYNPPFYSERCIKVLQEVCDGT